MYMALMIFSAQSASSAEALRNQHQSGESLENSLTGSLTSADSAIAECNNQNNKQKNGQSYQGQEARQLYGNFYFATDDTVNQANYKSINEKTPLVISNGVYKSNGPNELRLNLPVQHQQQQQQHRNQFDSSASLNLGLVMKNSTRLANEDFLKSGKHFDDEDEHEDNWVSSKWILVPMLPLTLSMKVLTPCKFKNTCWTIWTFIVSICLIGGLTYVSVWMVHCFGQSVGIPETVAGMTILSWGTGIPELIASIVLIKKTAQADMAICNTIGSNVIDVSFCLSLPWIVKCFMNKAGGMKPEVEIQSSALPWTSVTLLLSVILLLLVFKLHDWTLDARVGIWLTLVYIAFVVTATYLESTFSKSGFDLLALI